MKHKTPDSMKFKRLMRMLGESRRGTAGLLELLWIATQNNAKRGDIGQYSNEEIAIECDYEGDPDRLVSALVETGWLDECPVHRLVVHDWPQHAPRYIHAWIKSQNTDFATAQTLPVKPIVNTTAEATVSTTVETTEDPIRNLTKPNLTYSLSHSDESIEVDSEKGGQVCDQPRSKHFASEEFRSVWRAWISKQELQNFRTVDPFTQESQLYDLETFSTEDAIAMVRFSTGRTNCRNLILDGSHKPKTVRAGPGSGGSVRAKVGTVSFEDGLLKPGDYAT